MIGLESLDLILFRMNRKNLVPAAQMSADRLISIFAAILGSADDGDIENSERRVFVIKD